MRSASSRSGTSISMYPLTTSLPSTNGPSMRTGSPRSSRTVVTVSGDRSLPPPRIFSAWVANHSAARPYARSRSAGPMASRSLAYCSVSTNNSTYFNLAPLRIFLGHPRGARVGALGSTAPARPGSGLAVQLGHPPHHLLRRYVLDVRRDGPPVPEGVHDVAVPVAVELVLRWALQRRAKLHCSCDDGIHVLDIDEQRRRGA